MINLKVTIVRRIIIAIAEHYKSNKTAKITNFIQGEYNRVIIHENTPISLHEVNESDILLALNETLLKLELDLTELLNFVSIVPAIDRNTKQLTAVVELKSAYFRHLINSSTKTKVHEDFILYTTDMYQLCGNDNHINYRELPKKPDSEVIAACINFDIAKSKGSCGLSLKELEAIKRLYIDIKYGGFNAFNDDEWLDIYKASTYRRALEDDALQCPENILGKPVTAKYKIAVEMHNVFFRKQERADFLIKNDFGRVIGRKTNLFSPAELIQQKSLPRYGAFKIAASRGQNASSSLDNNEVVLDPFDFGNFNHEILVNNKRSDIEPVKTISPAEHEHMESCEELIISDFLC